MTEAHPHFLKRSWLSTGFHTQTPIISYVTGEEVRGSHASQCHPLAECSDGLSEVLGRKHALCPAQDGVLGGIIGMFFGRDLQHGRDGLHMGVYGVADHLGDKLVDQNNADVVPCQEAPDGLETHVKRWKTKPV